MITKVIKSFKANYKVTLANGISDTLKLVLSKTVDVKLERNRLESNAQVYSITASAEIIAKAQTTFSINVIVVSIR